MLGRMIVKLNKVWVSLRKKLSLNIFNLLKIQNIRVWRIFSPLRMLEKLNVCVFK